MHQAHTCHTAVPSLAVGSCTAHCGDHRLRAGNLRGSSGRLQEGEEGESAHGEHTPSLPCPPPPPRALTGTVGEAVEAGAALLARGSRVARAAAAQPAHPTQLVHGAPGVTGAGCRGLGVMPWGTCSGPPPCPEPQQSHSLTVALGVAVVAQAAAVTVGAVELWPARAVASVVTTLREGPHRAAAAHCRPRVHGALSWQPRPNPTPACPLRVPYSHWQRGKWK